MTEMENKNRNSRGFFGRLKAAFRSPEFERARGGDSDPLLSALERLDLRMQDLPRALSEGLGASLGSLADSLRPDRGERDAWEKALKESETRFLAVADAHLARTRETLAGLARTWDEATQGHLGKMETALTKVFDSFAAGWKEMQSESKSHFKSGADALLQGVKGARESMAEMSTEASTHFRNSAGQAGTWLKNLSEAAEKMLAAAQEARRMGEDSSATQAGLKSVVETLNQSLTGVLDRLQSLASLGQGQEALLEKMEATIRRFEERSVELLEDNALKVQESFLDALEKIGGDARGD